MLYIRDKGGKEKSGKAAKRNAIVAMEEVVNPLLFLNHELQHAPHARL